MSDDAFQEAEVEIEIVVTRLVPCAEHELAATGEPVIAGGVHVQNPNGYRHDCSACAATPTHRERIE